MCIAAIRWMGVRVDMLSSLFVGLVAIASIMTSQDAGNTHCLGLLWFLYDHRRAYRVLYTFSLEHCKYQTFEFLDKGYSLSAY